jgi:TonB family protein
MLQAFERYWHGDQAEIRLLLDRRDPEQSRRLPLAAAGAVLYHVAFLLIVLNAPGGSFRAVDAAQLTLDLRRATPLVAPTKSEMLKLTQREPQRGKPAAEVDLAALLPKPAIRQPFSRPLPGAGLPPAPQPAERVKAIEEPPVMAAQFGLPQVQAPQVAAPPPPQSEKPKLAFERVGLPQGLPQAAGTAKIEVPRSSLEDDIRVVAQTGGGRGLVVGDIGAGGGGGSVSEAMRQLPSPGRMGSALELLSDARGVDFRPYLIQVLAAVKRNWQAVMPESARFGRQGRVAIQFAIDKNGRVPKLVIASSSGADALDRAAVAGISASNPFPPLPAEFQGSEIRLQLVFSYNMPR